jgi:hypothetical protein
MYLKKALIAWCVSAAGTVISGALFMNYGSGILGLILIISILTTFIITAAIITAKALIHFGDIGLAVQHPSRK